MFLKRNKKRFFFGRVAQKNEHYMYCTRFLWYLQWWWRLGACRVKQCISM